MRRKQATCDGPQEKPLQQRTEGENLSEGKIHVKTKSIKNAILGSVKSAEKNQEHIEALVRNYKWSKVEMGGGQEKSKQQSCVDPQKEVDSSLERDKQEQVQEINCDKNLLKNK